MTRCGTTGPSAPAWIREQVSRQEEAWPLAALAAGLGALILVELLCGARVWNAEPWVVYACP
jgi:hypothetical protein